MNPIILCAGVEGQALIYGLVRKYPEPGQPVKLFIGVVGAPVGFLDEFRVCVLSWGILRVGCEIQPLEWWETNWREISSHAHAAISDDEANALIATAKSHCKK